jgi:hypothetical protein
MVRWVVVSDIWWSLSMENIEEIRSFPVSRRPFMVKFFYRWDRLYLMIWTYFMGANSLTLDVSCQYIPFLYLIPSGLRPPTMTWTGGGGDRAPLQPEWRRKMHLPTGE